MKKLILALAALAALSGASAQQAIWGVPTLASPEIHPDRSVTFRLVAPGAETVAVAGDFLSDAPFAAMQRDSTGLWTYTSAPLEPELYSYAFFVDSLRMNDPSNAFVIRDVGTVSNIFIVPADSADLYLTAEVPHGTVSRRWYPSPALGMDRRLTVYTPPGYETSTESYPVLYLLHGMGGDEEAWPALGRATQILDNLIAAGEAEPMIVVMPNGNASESAAPGEKPGPLKQPTTALPHTMDGTFEQAFPDLVSWVDANYRTKADKAHRAVAGLSMGGSHACFISMNYPDDFGYVGLFSAAVRPINPDSSPIYADIDSKLARQFANPPALYWIGIGKDDFLYGVNKDYRARLDQAGYPYVYVETEGGHTWRNWRDYLSQFVPQLFR